MTPIINKFKRGQLLVDINLIFFMFVPLILVGKLIRWTFMRPLIDYGIGFAYLRMAFDERIDMRSGTGLILGEFILFFSRFGLTTYLQFEILITVLWNIMILIILLNCNKYLTLLQAVFIALSVMVLNIFAFTLAKEPMQMLYFILIYPVLCSEKLSYRVKFLLITAIIIFSAITFRQYFYFIVYYMIIGQISLALLLRRHKPLIVTLAFMLLVNAIGYFTLFHIMPHMSYIHYHELIRVRQTIRGPDATSVIAPSTRVDTYFWLGINYIVISLRLLFPVELLRLGIRFWPYVIYQLVITGVFLRRLATYSKSSEAAKLATLVFFGFFAVSASFEPDFGSWIRHESVLFPIFLIMTKIKEDGYIETNLARV